MTEHRVGTREEWLAARIGLLEAEKRHTRRGDELARRRRGLPRVQIEKEYRFEAEEGTVVVANCCDSPVFLEFEKGHWYSVYRTALQGDLPPLEMRVQTNSRPAGRDLPDGVPNHARYSLKFMRKLFAAWIAMLLRR